MSRDNLTPRWSPDRETAAKIADLTDRLERAEEEVRFLKAAMTIPAGIEYAGLSLTKSEWVVIEELFAAHHPRAAQTYLRGRLDVALGSREAIGIKTVDVVICRLRKKLLLLTPPIAIMNQRGAGYFFTDADRESLALRRHLIPGRQPPEQESLE